MKSPCSRKRCSPSYRIDRREQFLTDFFGRAGTDRQHRGRPLGEMLFSRHRGHDHPGEARGKGQRPGTCNGVTLRGVTWLRPGRGPAVRCGLGRNYLVVSIVRNWLPTTTKFPSLSIRQFLAAREAEAFQEIVVAILQFHHLNGNRHPLQLVVEQYTRLVRITYRHILLPSGKPNSKLVPVVLIGQTGNCLSGRRNFRRMRRRIFRHCGTPAADPPRSTTLNQRHRTGTILAPLRCRRHSAMNGEPGSCTRYFRFSRGRLCSICTP